MSYRVMLILTMHNVSRYRRQSVVDTLHYEYTMEQSG